MRSKAHPSVIVALALVLGLSPLASLRSEEAAAEKAEPKAEEKAESKKEEPASEAAAKSGRKSPGLAGGLAFFPGFVVHGTGHMYAGSWMKGLGLLAIEGAAIGIGVSTVNAGISDIEKTFGNSQGAPTNVGTAYQTIGVALVCSMAFLWTWFDDMAGAPIAANEYNRLAEERENQAKFQISPMGDGAALALVRKF